MRIVIAIWVGVVTLAVGLAIFSNSTTGYGPGMIVVTERYSNQNPVWMPCEKDIVDTGGIWECYHLDGKKDLVLSYYVQGVRGVNGR